MKVLVKGDESVFKIDCPSCCSRLEYENDDLHEEYDTFSKSRFLVTDYMIYCPVDYVIYCPVCKQRIKVR